MGAAAPFGRGSFGSVFECEKSDGVGGFPTLFGGDAPGQGSLAVKTSAVKVIPIPSSDSQIAELRAEGMPADASASYFRQIAEDCVKEIKTMESLKSSVERAVGADIL